MEIIPVNPQRKNFASGGMYRTIRNGPRGQDLREKSITLPSLEDKVPRPARCRCVCRASGPTVTRSAYIQPARPKNYAPIRVYQRPTQPIEDGTIYRKSYMPVDGDRPDAILPTHNLGFSRAGFAKDTINKMSFPGWYNPAPPDKILPCNHDMLGKGPMTDVTINRQDYAPKNVDRVDPILPHNNLFVANTPMPSSTTNRLSYMQNDFQERAQPILPHNWLELPKGAVECNTIQKMSYQPCKIPHKEFLPWAQKKKYETPTVALQNDTVYRKSYIPNTADRIGPIIPKENKGLLGDGNNFDSNTIYHMSYPGSEGCFRPDAILPLHNIHLSNQRMEGHTIQKMSFQPNPCHMPPSAIRPCNHDLLGKGRMEDITTNRRDYVPRESDRAEPILPHHNINLSDSPLSDHTTNRMSYMDPGYNDVVQKILPTNNLKVTGGQMERNTIQKMSYQPVQPVDKMDMPWAEKRKYSPPTQAFVDDTCYRMSYDAPGEWVGGGGGGGGGCECPPEGGCPCYNPVPVPVVG